MRRDTVTANSTIRRHLMAMAFLRIVIVCVPAQLVAADDEGWISFAGSGGHLTFDATINDQPATVLLDSGADTSVISARLAELAQIRPNRNRPVRMTGVFGQETVYGSREFTMEVAGQSFPLRDVPIAPSASFDLILGRGLFQQVVVQIDYPNHRFRFLPSDAVTFESNVRVRRGNRGALLLETRIEGKRAWLHLDTGNNGVCLLKRSFVLRHGLKPHQVDSARMLAGGVIGHGAIQLLEFEEVEIGPYRFESFLAGYIAERNEGFDGRVQRGGSRISRENSPEDGLLGFEVLRNFVVTMDFKRRKVHLDLP